MEGREREVLERLWRRLRQWGREIGYTDHVAVSEDTARENTWSKEICLLHAQETGTYLHDDADFNGFMGLDNTAVGANAVALGCSCLNFEGHRIF